MSQLAKYIKAVQTRERHALQMPISSVVSIEEKVEPTPYRCAYTYNIRATFGFDAIVEDDEAKIAAALEIARGQVVHAVFGEFRGDIMAIERALFDMDISTALSNLMELERKMFEV